ncbi:hypothetical protein ACHAWF_010967 [Thalassiosira exigua]
MDDDTEMKMVEGYEYVHPDIVSMLLTNARQESDPGSPCSFVVNSDTLTLHKASSAWQESDQCEDNDVMPIDLLAALADECDRVVFGGQMHGHATKKILGLIHLSRLSESEGNDEGAATNSLEAQIEGRSPAVLVATMIGTLLLESSIRAVVVCNRDNPKKDGRNLDSSSARGAPLLRDMIQEISSMDQVTEEVSCPPKDIIAVPNLAPILSALLFPTKLGGINLRNMISHGFLSAIERRWLSLTLVLTSTLDHLIAPEEHFTDEGNGNHEYENTGTSSRACKRLGETVPCVEHGTSSLTIHPSMASRVRHGRSILMQKNQLRAKCVPTTHMSLLRFGLRVLAPTIGQHVETMGSEPTKTTSVNHEQQEPPPLPLTSLPAIFAALLCCLLEHSLRLLWCKSNNSPFDSIARPSEYYCTLDGHGQRDKHEVMITPYLRDGVTMNRLISLIGAESCAILLDLFASKDGPNVRSSLFHGTWDDEIVKELERLVSSGNCRERNNPMLVDSASAVLSCLDMISFNVSRESGYRFRPYQPVYSYTATAVRSSEKILRNLAELEKLITNNSYVRDCVRTTERSQPQLCASLRQFAIEPEAIRKLACYLFPTMRKAIDELWSVDDTYSEYQTNIALAETIAALTLLSDASNAIDNYVAGIGAKSHVLPTQPTSTKDRRILKTASRYCSVAMIAHDFLQWTVYVALVVVEQRLLNKGGDAGERFLNRADIVKAAERSRMTISTFDSYILTNMDRSLKAIRQYLQGKAVNKILCYKSKGGDDNGS